MSEPAYENDPRAKAALPRKDTIVRSDLPKRTLLLRRAVGNQALSRDAAPPTLTVSRPYDPHEREADRIADSVMHTPDSALQRKCECEGECSTCQDDEPIGERLQAKHAPANEPHAGTAPPIVHDVLRSSGRPLDSATRDFMEPRFGRDFSDVRVHTDAQAAASARAVQAKAYTVGNEIVFGSNAFAPESSTGRELLAHELTHTIQQGAASLRRLADESECDESSENVEEDMAAEDVEESSTSDHDGPGNGRRPKSPPYEKCFKFPSESGPRLRFLRKKRKKGKGLLHLKRKCCTEYDLSDVKREEVASVTQPDVVNKETNRDLAPIGADCTYIVDWDVYAIPDRVLITDNKTRAVYTDNNTPGSGQRTIAGPASVHIRVVPHPTLRPTQYRYNVSKICGRVKVIRSCYVMGIRVEHRISRAKWDPTKDYSKKCDDDD